MAVKGIPFSNSSHLFLPARLFEVFEVDMLSPTQMVSGTVKKAEGSVGLWQTSVKRICTVSMAKDTSIRESIVLMDVEKEARSKETGKLCKQAGKTGQSSSKPKESVLAMVKLGNSSPSGVICC